MSAFTAGIWMKIGRFGRISTAGRSHLDALLLVSANTPGQLYGAGLGGGGGLVPAARWHQPKRGSKLRRPPQHEGFVARRAFLVKFQHGFKFFAFGVVFPCQPAFHVLPGADNEQVLRIVLGHQCFARDIAGPVHGPGAEIFQDGTDLFDLAFLETPLDENLDQHVGPPFDCEYRDLEIGGQLVAVWVG